MQPRRLPKALSAHAIVTLHLIVVAVWLVGCVPAHDQVSKDDADMPDSSIAVAGRSIDSVPTARRSIDTLRARTFRFRIDTTNPRLFGADHWWRVPISIDIDEPYVYIADNYHNNIKRLDTRTGKIKSSATFTSPDAHPVDDIECVNGNIYVSNVSDSIYVLDSSLRVERIINLPTRAWRSVQTFYHRHRLPVMLNCAGIDSVIVLTGDTSELIPDAELHSHTSVFFVRGRVDKRMIHRDNGFAVLVLPSGSVALLGRDSVPEYRGRSSHWFTMTEHAFAYMELLPSDMKRAPSQLFVHVFVREQ